MEEESSLKMEELDLKKSHEQAREKRERERQERHHPIVEAEKISNQVAAKKSEVEAKGQLQYKGCFGKCNNKFCRKAKSDHFGPDYRCLDPAQVSPVEREVLGNPPPLQHASKLLKWHTTLPAELTSPRRAEVHIK